MKKKQVINLIRYFTEGNTSGFRTEAYEIAKAFDKAGDHQLAEYIIAMLSENNTFIPQVSEEKFESLRKIQLTNFNPLPLPEAISSDVIGVVNAVRRNIGVDKFLFEGAPGTGKTETVKQIARLLQRELYVVDFETIIDSKLGQTAKNIANLFKEINSFTHPEQTLILFDEIDAIALNRLDNNDLREMGRATTAILKGMDTLRDGIVLIATTNLFSAFDKALIRRFDAVINFNRYSQEDLLVIAESMMSTILNDSKHSGKNVRLFKKIVALCSPIPYPGELKNTLKSAVAFSSLTDKFDYLRRLFSIFYKPVDNTTLKELKELGFTVREIEILTGISKSQTARELKED
ncbi:MULTISPECIES: ATP-binding protein [Streptococcus]|uniref:AAA family ATPase n=1 Tax=Streptococcus suis TaxID=1307 RepID=A0A4T2GU72_STRSU|nr:ATP-binding protein [Streptococcus suis]MBO3838869.1 AAA family ATPase [Streptococcus suis]MBO4114479.1 AAA family ATPase [Streptococcus suis]MCK4075733.1 AAA family ATPase [Streptococcus suis]MDG4480892.1 ATP-binding protein [Streptococcus suis]MDG4485823.1 ATP-binding protein [Streptococcus suis]